MLPYVTTFVQESIEEQLLRLGRAESYQQSLKADFSGICRSETRGCWCLVGVKEAGRHELYLLLPLRNGMKLCRLL